MKRTTETKDNKTKKKKDKFWSKLMWKLTEESVDISEIKYCINSPNLGKLSPSYDKYQDFGEEVRQRMQSTATTGNGKRFFLIGSITWELIL